MPVQKYNSETKINHQPIPYTQINTYVIQNLTNMEAGWVWLYLLSKPVDWLVIKAHLKNHFNIGNAKVKSILSYLAKCHLIENIQIRDEKGRIVRTDVNVLNGENFINISKLSTDELSIGSKIEPMDIKKKKFLKNQTTLSTGSKTQRLDNPAAGLQPTTDKRYIQIKEEDKKERERAKNPLPPKSYISSTFLPDEIHEIIAQKLNLNVSIECEHFIDYYKAHGKTMADWDAAFSSWLRKAEGFNKKAQRNEDVPRSAVNRMPFFVSEKNIIRKQL